MTLSGVFSAWARLPTWVRARSTTSRLASSSRLTSAASGATSCGKVAADAFGLAAADRRQALLKHAQRPEAETHRQRGRAEQRHRQHQEGRGERVFEPRDLGLDHVGVGRDLNEIAPVVVVDLALDHAQRLVAGPDDIAAPDRPRGRSIASPPARLGNCVANSEREVRISGCGRSSAGDLPVPAGEGELELRVDDRQRAALELVVGRGDIGDQRLQIDAELLVEIRFGRARVERRQAEPGDDQDRRTPERGGHEQPRSDRLGVERLADGRQSEPAAAERSGQRALLRLAPLSASGSIT